MASEYIKDLIKDEKPAEAPPPLTAKQRRQNWLHYHKWHLIIGTIAVLILLDLGRSALHIGEVQPDVRIAFAGKYVLPEETVPAICEALSLYCPDANGDGRRVVQLNTYPQPDPEAGGDSAVTLRTASVVQMMSDLESCASFLFLLDDPVSFEGGVRILAYPDGSLPDEAADPAVYVKDCALSWADCPGLAALTAPGGALADADETVRSYLESLSIARRGFWTEKTARYPEACEAFWANLQAGTPAP